MERLLRNQNKELKMVSNEQIKNNLIEIYSKYIKNRDDGVKKEAYEIYLKYFNGADTIFSEEVSDAIWNSFDLSEEKLDKEKAKEILKELNKSK